jgi:hypothetical protein
MVMLRDFNSLRVEKRRICHLNGGLKPILMRKALLRLKNIKRFRDQLLISDIFLFPLPGNGRGVLRNHLWAMDDVNDKFVHPFFSSNFFVSPRSHGGSDRNRTAHYEQLQQSPKWPVFACASGCPMYLSIAIHCLKVNPFCLRIASIFVRGFQAFRQNPAAYHHWHTA